MRTHRLNTRRGLLLPFPRLALLPLLLAGALLELAPAAQAGFTRPFVHRVSEAKLGEALEPVALEVDRENNDLLVQSGSSIDEFEAAPANGFVESRAGSLPGVRRAESCSLTACSVDVVERTAVERFKREGLTEAPERFSAAESYLGGEHHNEIVGVPQRQGAQCEAEITFGFPTLPEAVAVDSAGDIYVAVPYCHEVYEFRSSGEYGQAFRLVPVSHTSGNNIEDLAFDPKSRHLLMTVSGEENGQTVGAVEEFETEGVEGGKFIAEITATPGGALRGSRHEHEMGIAVDSNGFVYVIEETAHAVDVWGPGGYFPSVTLGSVTDRTKGSAILNGFVVPAQRKNPAKAAQLAGCFFEYVEEAVYVRALGEGKEEGFPVGVFREAACEDPSAAQIPTEAAGEAEKSYQVHATAEGLAPGHTYRYRLLASSGGEAQEGGTAHTGEVFAFTAPVPPRVVSTAVGGVSSSFADLRAQIDPEGAGTSYHFEYDERPYAEGEGPHGASVPVPSASLGSGGATGSAVEGVEQSVGGLAPGTTYHFRVVAESECQAVEHPGAMCVSAGEDESFTTEQPASASARGYELVTPADKEGGGDMFAEPETNGTFVNADNHVVAAESGEAALLEGESAFGAYPFGQGQAYVFDRGAPGGGWSYASLAVPRLGVQLRENGVIYDPADLSRVALNDGLGAPVGEEGTQLVNLLGPPGAGAICRGAVSVAEAVARDCYIELHRDPATHESDGGQTRFVGASRELTTVALESSDNGACPGVEDAAGRVTHGDVLCEWSGAYDGAGEAAKPELALVNVSAGDEAKPVSECGASLGALGEFAANHSPGQAYRAVSADGSRVLFTAPDPDAANATGGEGCWDGLASDRSPEEQLARDVKNAPQLYARVQAREGGEVSYRTLRLSAPEAGAVDPTGTHAAIYVGASEDGAHVFFATDTELTEEAVALKVHGLELYEWRAQGAEGAGGPCGEASAGWVAASEGCLTRASAAVSGSPVAVGGAEAQAGARVHMTLAVAPGASEGAVVYFTANGVLATNENSKGERAVPGDCESSNGACALYHYQSGTADAPARTTFVANVQASSFGRNGEGGNFLTPEPRTTQAYTTPDGGYLLFLNGGEESGGPIYRYDAQNETLTFVAVGAFTVSAADESPAAGPVRAMSDDGGYVFFNTAEALVPQAKNDTLDTYEWHDGQISLVGSGEDPAPTYFLGYAPYEYTNHGGERVKVEGGNVFLGTHSRLSVQDVNSVGNIYDARVCEAESPCIQLPVGETAQCEGGSCQTPPSAPLYSAPASLTFSGPGNAVAAAPKAATATKAEKLAKALTACRKLRAKRRRVTCEKTARRRYGAKSGKRTGAGASKSARAKKSARSRRGSGR